MAIVAGLDIGSTKSRAVVASIKPGEDLQILGPGEVESCGMRRGVVVDIGDVASIIRDTAAEARAVSGISFKKVLVGVNGAHVASQNSRGVVAVSRADREITEADVDRVVRAAEAVTTAQNREILQVIARSFNIDQEEGIKNPVGMNGVRLEVNALILTAATAFLKNLTKAVEKGGLEVEELVPGPLASAEAVIDKKQKELGVLILDFGGQTTSMAVYEEGEIAFIKVLPVGSAHITSDLAIGLRTDIDTAEKVKIQYGSCLPAEIRKTEIIDLGELGLEERIKVRRQEVAEIIEARIKEIFDLVNSELSKIDRKGLLPAGVILVGGGAKIPGLVELAKDVLMLPAQIGYPSGLKGLVDKVSDPSFAKVVGLLIWATMQEEVLAGGGKGQEWLEKIGRFFRNLLP